MNGKPNDFNRSARDYARIETAIRYLERHRVRQPDLTQLAAHLGLSEGHLQRLFSRWAGISPKRFLQFLTLEHTKTLLRNTSSTLDAAHAAGLSSTSRLHDLYVECESMTPGEYRRLGAGLEIRFAFHHTPFGESLVATTDRGLCALMFVNRDGHQNALETLRRNWPQAKLTEDPGATFAPIHRVFAHGGGHQRPLYLLVKGTNFQINVWEALLRIPPGQLVSYQAVARRLGAPQASRAVASAVARNPLHFLIPCHRVIRSIGDFGGYQGGSARKMALHGWEAARYPLSARK